MSRNKLSLSSAACLVACLLLFPAIGFAQTKPDQRPEQKPEQKPDASSEGQDVIKFDTSLVQTDVMVFDKQGRPVKDLRPEQFQLRINKTPREISFFEAIASGSATMQSEAPAEPNAAKPDATKPDATKPNPLRQDLQRRAIIFFVDDLHLAPDSLVRTRKALLDFIDNRIQKNDLIAITSPSGQVGFLQQFTDNKEALRSAVARLNYRTNNKTDMDKPPMSLYIAMKIREGDEQAMVYYIQQVQQEYCYPNGICSITPESAREMVKNRANQIVTQSAPATDDTLRLLEGLMRTAAQIPGRKLAFVISDGFYLSDTKTSSIDRIKRVTDAAGRAGVVIYTLDARGIVSDQVDVTDDKPIDSKGMLTRAGIGGISASQDGLNALASDTGGQAFLNTNQPMHEWVEKVIDETSSYYLLAWKPDNDEQKRGKFKNIDVSVVGRPDLKVRFRTSYFKSAALPLLTTKKKAEKDPAKAREDDMRLVIDAPVTQREIPAEVDLRFSQLPGFGTRVIATISIDDASLTFDQVEGKLAADVDIGGIVYDDKGKPLDSFVGRLRIFQRSPSAPATGLAKRSIYRFTTLVPGGLYQVRVALRDLKSSRTGSAMDWIKVPKI
jgi:VWFA-related protein